MIFVLIVALAMAALTWLFGWWGVVVGALVFGALRRAEGGRAWSVAFGAGLAWIGLLAGDASKGALPVVVKTTGGAMGVPGVVVLVVTVLFAMLIGWSAAAAAGELAGAIGPDPTL